MIIYFACSPYSTNCFQVRYSATPIWASMEVCRLWRHVLTSVNWVMSLGQWSAILWNLSMKVLIDYPFFCLAASRVGTEISVSSSKKWARVNFSRSAHVLIEPVGSFTNHLKVTSLRVPINKWAIKHRLLLHSLFGTWSSICLGSVTLYHQKYGGLVPWIWEGREPYSILLGKVRLSPRLEGRLALLGLRDVVPIYLSSWNDCFHFLSYSLLQIKIWVAQSWNAFHSQCL